MSRLQDAARDVRQQIQRKAFVVAENWAELAALMPALDAALAAEQQQPSRNELAAIVARLIHPMADDSDVADAQALLARIDAAGRGK